MARSHGGADLKEASPADGLNGPAAGGVASPEPKSDSPRKPVDRFTRPHGSWIDPPAGNRLTASVRIAPSFLILGAQRSGTTSLYRYLAQHPRIFPALRKEVHYFDFQYDKGRRWYLAHFPTATSRFRGNGRPVTGEATPYYLVHPLAPQRVWEFNPAMKLIVILRDPVERAFSHYNHEVRRGVETLDFRDAVDAEPERLSGADGLLRRAPHYYSYSHHHFSYFDRGRYAHHLQAWLDRFPLRQLLILKSDEMFLDANRVANEVFAFLDLPPHRLPLEEAPAPASNTPAVERKLRKRLEAYFAADQERLQELVSSTARARE